MTGSHDPRYDEAKRARAKELYEEPNMLSVRGVAAALRVSPQRAYDLLKDAGVEFRPRSVKGRKITKRKRGEGEDPGESVEGRQTRGSGGRAGRRAA